MGSRSLDVDISTGHQEPNGGIPPDVIEQWLQRPDAGWTWTAGAPRSFQTALPWENRAELCLGPCGGPRGGGLSCERGTPVSHTIAVKGDLEGASGIPPVPSCSSLLPSIQVLEGP